MEITKKEVEEVVLEGLKFFQAMEGILHEAVKCGTYEKEAVEDILVEATYHKMELEMFQDSFLKNTPEDSKVEILNGAMFIAKTGVERIENTFNKLLYGGKTEIDFPNFSDSLH